ncbi:NADH-quinone oxidoreductase subunit A [Desulfothermobacter acidiphilus]|uniref:NADH-quinone oxidoreductase subunit A n=1 Tax=Desulfothermobacter acidiphilus TaxID=1938353 RepID=UPI003F88C22F
MSQYALLFVLLLGALGVAGGSLALSWILRPHPTPVGDKRAIYECGLRSEGSAWVQFKARYFLYALIFLLFDAEAVFLYPWAVCFRRLEWLGFIEMVIFIGILALGLWYAWKRGGLRWW